MNSHSVFDNINSPVPLISAGDWSETISMTFFSQWTDEMDWTVNVVGAVEKADLGLAISNKTS